MDNKEKSPEKELIESIGLMIEKGMESNTNIYTGVVKSVDGKRAVVAVNGQNQNVSIATADVSSGNVVRVFVPKGNMSAAFIIKAEASGGGETTTTAYGDLTGKPQINGVTLVDNKTSKELNLYGTGNEPPYPVTSVNGQTGDVTIEVGGNVDSVNGKTGAVVLSAADVGAVSKTGDTMTGNLTVGSASLQTNGYVTGTWLRTTANTSLGSAASKIAVLNDGWVYSRTTGQIKSDIGLGNVDNVKQYSASNPPPYPVTSVNGKTGAITIHEVPSVTTADNGKFLRVVNGAWAAVAIADANGVKF